jgi:hypothetical protein
MDEMGPMCTLVVAERAYEVVGVVGDMEEDDNTILRLDDCTPSLKPIHSRSPFAVYSISMTRVFDSLSRQEQGVARSSG